MLVCLNNDRRRCLGNDCPLEEKLEVRKNHKYFSLFADLEPLSAIIFVKKTV